MNNWATSTRRWTPAHEVEPFDSVQRLVEVAHLFIGCREQPQRSSLLDTVRPVIYVHDMERTLYLRYGQVRPGTGHVGLCDTIQRPNQRPVQSVTLLFHDIDSQFEILSRFFMLALE